MNPEWFAGRLRELREQAGLSREQLAERAGMQSVAGIRNLEQGIRRPAWETVLALCQALGVTCDAFTQPPGEVPPPRAGRPKKPASDPQPPARPEARPGRRRQASTTAPKKAAKKGKGK